MFLSILSATLSAALVIVAISCYRSRKKMEQMLRQQQAEQSAISEFAAYVVNQDILNDILWTFMQSCVSKLGFTDCVIYLLDKESNKLVQKAAYGPKNPNPLEILNPIEISVGKGIVGWVALKQESEIISDTSKDVRYIVDDERRLSEIAVPICYKGELIGVIDSEHPSKGFFTESHKQMLETLSSMCAAKIIKLRALGERKLFVNRLQSLLEYTPDFILLSTPSGDCLYANKSYIKYFGINESDMSNSKSYRMLNNEERFEFLNHISNINRKNPSVSYLKISAGKNRQKQWTLWNETGVFDEEGNLVEVISVGRDISELRKAHETTEQHIKTLEEILQQNSHKVRQPVTQLMGIATLLEHGLENKEELNQMLSYMRQSVTQLDSYTRELNDFVFNSCHSN
jgi:PAS domain S-box-containing protein